jgi:hypothetical protein
MNPLALLTMIPSLAKQFLAFATTPVGAAIIAFGLGYFIGDRRADQKCAAEITRREEAAKHLDVKAAEIARDRARADAAANAKKAAELDRKVKDYEEVLKRKAGASDQCALDDYDLERLSDKGSGVGSDPAASIRRRTGGSGKAANP